MRRAILLGLAGGLLLSSVAAAKSPAAVKSPQARIPFANSGGIAGWQSAGRDAILIQGSSRNWYRAETLGYCQDLDTATGIGFETGTNGDFDSFSKLIVRGQRCPLKSLVRVDPPQKKAVKTQN